MSEKRKYFEIFLTFYVNCGNIILYSNLKYGLLPITMRDVARISSVVSSVLRGEDSVEDAIWCLVCMDGCLGV